VFAGPVSVDQIGSSGCMSHRHTRPYTYTHMNRERERERDRDLMIVNDSAHDSVTVTRFTATLDQKARLLLCSKRHYGPNNKH